MNMGGADLWGWGIFLAVIVVLLAFDLGVLNKKDHEMSMGESARLSLFYISIGLAFGLFIWVQFDANRAFQYYTGFILEKTLSLDNIFVIALIFGYFNIPREFQHRVLFWGIIGAIILRAILIGAGSAIVAEFEWVLYLFAAFLIFTGIKMLKSGDEDEEPDLSQNKVLKFLRSRYAITDDIHGNKFAVMLPNAQGVMTKHFTPLFVALVLVECADVIFALDSVPAIFMITNDTFVIYTSNIFAILGLRAMFFILSAALKRFEYLQFALSILLIFIGSKIFLAHILFPETHKFPAGLSLGITVGILAAGVIYSLIKTKDTHTSE
ncbi:MAG: TerC family protein [Alphaproteobacteria bacterium]|nr:MAG: TerC family protein [Alphaproteobacteria bacterium]